MRCVLKGTQKVMRDWQGMIGTLPIDSFTKQGWEEYILGEIGEYDRIVMKMWSEEAVQVRVKV